MEDVHSAGIKKYQKCEPDQPKPLSDILGMYFELFIDFVHVLFLSISVWFTVIKNLIIKVPPKDISGQLAMVTGGGNGLGRELCIRLAKEGCNVVVVDVDIEAAEKTSTDIKLYNIETKAYKCDVTNYKEVKKLRNEIEEDLGPVDILINNAGLMPLISLREGVPEDIQKVLSVNITSHFWTLRVFLEDMIRRRKGHIVAISSMAGYEPIENVVYCTSKFAIRGFMESLYEVLRKDKLDKAIFTTTAYPYFLNTRKDVMTYIKAWSCMRKFPPLSPEYAAEQIVMGLRKNKVSVYIPLSSYLHHCFLSILPTQIRIIYKDIFFSTKKI